MSAPTSAVGPENGAKVGVSHPDLQLVIDAWDSLPQAVRVGILAMVKASKPDSS
jgi:hypothetical protein